VNWIPAIHKAHKNTKSSYNIAGKVEMSTLSNRFSPLDNLKVNREDEVIAVDNKENLSISSTMKNATRENGISKIPTIINGRVKNSDMENPSKSNSYVPKLISLSNVIMKLL
jgi:protein-tyrosine-phosphatase